MTVLQQAIVSRQKLDGTNAFPSHPNSQCALVLDRFHSTNTIQLVAIPSGVVNSNETIDYMTVSTVLDRNWVSTLAAFFSSASDPDQMKDVTSSLSAPCIDLDVKKYFSDELVGPRTRTYRACGVRCPTTLCDMNKWLFFYVFFLFLVFGFVFLFFCFW
jgi:hypothetical protein